MAEEATIRRGVRNARYTTVPNHVFEDVRLSMEARWLLGYLLSKPDNWTVILGDIAKRGGCGRDKARRIVNELVQHGYAEKEQEREEGRFGKLSLVIFDEPREQRESSVAEGAVASLPQTENPSTVNPSTANPTLVNTDGLVTPDSNPERERGREDRKKIEASFWRMVRVWPQQKGMPTDRAWRAFLALTDEERAEAERKFPLWLALLKAQKKDHTPAPSTYFEQKLWVDVPKPEPEKPKPTYAPAFGPVWAGIRMRDLVTGPKAEPAPLKGWEERAIADGTLNRAVLEKGNLMRAGWPMVNALHFTAETRGLGVHDFGPVEEALGKLCEFVPIDGDCWNAWKAEHERRGWPWLPDPGSMRGVYFPAGGPDGLEAFEQALRGNHDAGGREAAE
jgi:hypothetical protein